MRTLHFLKKLQQTSSSLLNLPVPIEINSPPVKKEMQFITELTFIYILKLLGIEDEKKLGKILSKLREGTPFYNFTFLAHNLAKSQTDFDFLTSPENLVAYAKIAEISKECGVVLLPYVNVLAKIAENKQYGLYSENQEVEFFLDEYYCVRNSVDAKEFLHQFKKILKFKTQILFERFINDRIFSLIHQTLTVCPSRITSEQTLAIYVYCLNYYICDISNEDENLLHEHIRFCVNYLYKHGEIKFRPYQIEHTFPNFKDEEECLNYFFIHNTETLNSLDRFCALLKDICPTIEAIEFCEFLRGNLYKSNFNLFDESKNHFNQIIARIIREKTDIKNVPIYNAIFNLLPQKFICQRSPAIEGRDGIMCYRFYDKNENFLFYTAEAGNKTKDIPEAHVLVELKILKRAKNGDVLLWSWEYLKTDKSEKNDRNSHSGNSIVCTPEFSSGRKPVFFKTYNEACKYLGLKEYELHEYIITGRPYNGYKITFNSDV